jgi:hypothetical protein
VAVHLTILAVLVALVAVVMQEIQIVQILQQVALEQSILVAVAVADRLAALHLSE